MCSSAIYGLSNDTLRHLQLTQLEILKVFDAFCRKNNLKYSLYAGSLLGAVRHKGFIPWDDDLDVCMTRAEYDRFIALWEKAPPTGYILQNKENSPAYWQSFSKIRKDHTTFLQEQREAGKYHTGIFLDIFPLDRMPNGRLNQLLFYWRCMRYQLLTREFIPQKSPAVVRFGSALILGCSPKSRRQRTRQKLLKKITQLNKRDDLEIVAIENILSLRTHFSADMAKQYIDLPFEDSQFMCFADWDDHLHHKFGDYMQPPPEEKRVCPHHPIIIDFEHNYEELHQ